MDRWIKKLNIIVTSNCLIDIGTNTCKEMGWSVLMAQDETAVPKAPYIPADGEVRTLDPSFENSVSYHWGNWPHLCILKLELGDKRQGNYITEFILVLNLKTGFWGLKILKLWSKDLKSQKFTWRLIFCNTSDKLKNEYVWFMTIEACLVRLNVYFLWQIKMVIKLFLWSLLFGVFITVFRLSKVFS